MKQIPLLSLLILLLVACGPTSTSVDTTLDETWNVVISESIRNNFDIESVELTENEKDAGVDVVYELKQNNVTKGFILQATVDGSGGNNSNIFRLGLLNNQFTGFQSVSHREHNGIGTVIIQTMVAQLAGKTATYDTALQIMINANATLTGNTSQETIDGMLPAIEAMVLRYLSI
jgi:Na+-translocating ferredoxin:NAD+ oxidoreductase RnfG subunit